MACPSENELYVAELLNWRTQKLICIRAEGSRRATWRGGGAPERAATTARAARSR